MLNKTHGTFSICNQKPKCNIRTCNQPISSAERSPWLSGLISLTLKRDGSKVSPSLYRASKSSTEPTDDGHRVSLDAILTIAFMMDIESRSPHKLELTADDDFNDDDDVEDSDWR